MVIWPEIRLQQYRVNDYPYHAPHLIIKFDYIFIRAITFISDLIASNSDHRLIDDDIDKASDLFPLSE